MAKGVFFTVRGRKGFRQRKHYKSKGAVLLVLVLVIAALTLRFTGGLAVTVSTVPAGAGQSGLTGWGGTLYLHILSNVIPGLVDTVHTPVPEEKANSDDVSGVVAMALPDLRDPKTIMSSQIPYLGEADARLQPLIHQAVAETDEPKIIIPVRQEITGEGAVIIYHTHTTESFVPDSGKNFTDNLVLTVAGLGRELSDLLRQQYKIPVIHDTQIHDIPRSSAYETALPTLKALLAGYPDAELVIDLHRDGVDRKVTTMAIEGQPAGRLLFVVGSRHPNWEENYQKAFFLHQALEELAPGLSRGVRERPLVYNQNLHSGSLLIELGGHENSLEEVRRSLPYLAQALSMLYNSGR